MKIYCSDRRDRSNKTLLDSLVGQDTWALAQYYDLPDYTGWSTDEGEWIYVKITSYDAGKYTCEFVLDPESGFNDILDCVNFKIRHMTCTETQLRIYTPIEFYSDDDFRTYYKSVTDEECWHDEAEF